MQSQTQCHDAKAAVQPLNGQSESSNAFAVHTSLLLRPQWSRHWHVKVSSALLTKKRIALCCSVPCIVLDSRHVMPGRICEILLCSITSELPFLSISDCAPAYCSIDCIGHYLTTLSLGLCAARPGRLCLASGGLFENPPWNNHRA